MHNKVEICGISTATLPKVKQQEVEAMLIRLKNGEEELKDEFIRSNLRLVLSVVQKFNHKRENLDDIFQIGCVGLIKAIDNFDFKYNVKFSTYAVPMDMESRDDILGILQVGRPEDPHDLRGLLALLWVQSKYIKRDRCHESVAEPYRTSIFSGSNI
jgi:hypothetical protein